MKASDSRHQSRLNSTADMFASYAERFASWYCGHTLCAQSSFNLKTLFCCRLLIEIFMLNTDLKFPKIVCFCIKLNNVV